METKNGREEAIETILGLSDNFTEEQKEEIRKAPDEDLKQALLDMGFEYEVD